MILTCTPNWDTKTLKKHLKQGGFKLSSHGAKHDVWCRAVQRNKSRTQDCVLVPRHKGAIAKGTYSSILKQAGVRPNARTYLDPSGWWVFDIGPKMGFAVVAPYHAGTLVTLPRGRQKYPLLLARWRDLRTDSEIQRYKTRGAASAALKRFVSAPCPVGGMVCP